MSWLSNLTSKAEAMLVKLDQDTAQALQNSDQILKPVSKIFDATSRGDSWTPALSSQQNEPLLPSVEPTLDEPELSEINPPQEQSYYETVVAGGDVSRPVTSNETNMQNGSGNENRADTVHHQQDARSDLTSSSTQPPQSSYAVSPDKSLEQAHRDRQTTNEQSANQNSPSQPSRFKLQTAKLRQPLSWNQTHASEAGPIGNRPHSRGSNSRANNIIVSPGVDDIRASINRSLQEYSRSSTTTAYEISRRGAPNDDQTIYTSHFDNQPNLVSHHQSPGSSPGSDYGDEYSTSGRLHSSPSFSIDVPNDGGVGHSSTSITNHILQQKRLHRQSTFSLHKVINKLTSQQIQSQSLISEKGRLRLRRAQMRLASQFRRLNYHFRTHPSIKYWAVGYLVLLQILVVYVLFFYQSSGSSNYLTAQVAQQQEELLTKTGESLNQNSEKLPLGSQHRHMNVVVAR